MSYLILPIRTGGKKLLVGIHRPPDPWLQFSMIGVRNGLLASEFATTADLRRMARELLRHANAIDGVEGLRCVGGGKQ